MPKSKTIRRAKRSTRKSSSPTLPKAPTGITGFDEITHGGIPRGRPTLLCGGPGCGKTIFSIEFLVNGIQDFSEPGVFIAFEETPEDLAKNVASLGYDLGALVAEKKLAVDWIHLDPSEIEETGAYTLDGLFVRLDLAIRSVKAKRIVIDTLEVLFGGLKDAAVLRAELQRLFRWLKARGLTAVITAERGEGGLTRNALEEYVSDCVVLLDQRVEQLITTRRLRVVKYRGSSHGADEYPFLIDDRGFSVLPMTSVQLDYVVSNDRVPTGITDLDEMMGGDGYYRTSTILVSGAAGTGKSSIAARMVDAACARGERCLMFALEESPSQIVRNMRSVGIDLEKWCKKGLLVIRATRPSLYGLEMHLLSMHREIIEIDPRVVVLDPISSLTTAGSTREVKSMMVRLFDALKLRQITGLMTYLTAFERMEQTDAGISSLIDTWLEVRDVEVSGERTRGLYVIKSRGMEHSNQVREFILSKRGIRLLDVYQGPNGILTGSARAAQDARLEAERIQRTASAARTRDLLARKETALRAHIAALEADFASEAESTRFNIEEEATRVAQELRQREASSERRSRSGIPTYTAREKR